MVVSRITLFTVVTAMAFAQMSLNAATSAASSEDILQAQKEVLRGLASPYGKQRYADRKISEYVKKGFPKEVFEPNELRAAVAKDMFGEFNKAGSRKRDMLLSRAKRTYGLEYEDFARFIPARTDFEGPLANYLTCQSDTERKEHFQSLVSAPFSTQEVRVLTERFSGAKTHETKTRLLKLFETETSVFSARFLWKYLVDHIDDPVRNDIIDVLDDRDQFDGSFVRAAIDKAIEKGHTRFIERAFGFAGREHSLHNRVATKILLDYLKNAPPARVNLIVPHFKRVIPPGTIDTMFAILNKADYSVCHYEVSSVLAKHFEKPEIKDKLVAFLLKKQSKQAALGFIDGVSLSWAIARRDDSGKEKLVSILNKLSSIHDDEVKKAVAKKIGTADDHQQRLNKRKKDKSLMSPKYSQKARRKTQALDLTRSWPWVKTV